LGTLERKSPGVLEFSKTGGADWLEASRVRAEITLGELGELPGKHGDFPMKNGDFMGSKMVV
jgi:hypothetical protein